MVRPSTTKKTRENNKLFRFFIKEAESFWLLVKLKTTVCVDEVSSAYNRMWNKLIGNKEYFRQHIIDDEIDQVFKTAMTANKDEWKMNFASQHAGAALMEYPKNSVGASGILSSSKDKYLIVHNTEK